MGAKGNGTEVEGVSSKANGAELDLASFDLANLLAIWSTSRDPRLSPLVVRLGERAAEPIRDLGDLKPTALGNALVEELRAFRVEKLHCLLPPIERFVRTARGSWPVVELLGEIPPDPRIARLALDLLRDYDDLPHRSTKLWRRLVAIVERHGDPETGAMLLWAPALGIVGVGVKPRLARVAAKLAASKPLAADALQRIGAAVEAFVPGVRPRDDARASGDALLAAIYADPTDDAARLVYADWLSANGDPRGEFIVLQYQRAEGKLTPAGERRERALLAKHFRTWLGPLKPVIKTWANEAMAEADELVVPVDGARNLAFARGFLAYVGFCEVPRHRDNLFEEACWSTVRRIGSVSRFSSAMRSLRAVENCPVAALASLSTLGRPLDALTITVRGSRDVASVLDVIPATHVGIRIYYGRDTALDWLAVATKPASITRTLRIEGSEYPSWTTAWSWDLLDRAPASFVEVALDIGLGERLVVRRGAGRWDELVVHATSIARNHAEWRDVFRPFVDRPARTMAVHVAKPGSAQAHADFRSSMEDFAAKVTIVE